MDPRPSRSVPSICNDFPVGVCVAHLMVGAANASLGPGRVVEPQEVSARNREVNEYRNVWRYTEYRFKIQQSKKLSKDLFTMFTCKDLFTAKCPPFINKHSYTAFGEPNMVMKYMI